MLQSGSKGFELVGPTGRRVGSNLRPQSDRTVWLRHAANMADCYRVENKGENKEKSYSTSDAVGHLQSPSASLRPSVHPSLPG